MTERLQKFIARSGLLSRRAAEKAIEEGRISVNGKIIRTQGVLVDPDKDRVCLDHKRIELPSETIVLLFHKPKGCVSTRSDPEGRPTVYDWIPKDLRVHAVGRLDFNSEGLLVFTNDGELSNLLMHPRFEIGKTYRARVRGHLTPEKIRLLLTGISLEDGMGRFTQCRSIHTPQVEIGEKSAANTWLEVEVQEGRKHFVRRMLEAVDLPVMRLIRVAQGPFALGDLKPGKFKLCTPEEIRDLEPKKAKAKGKD